MSRAAKIAKRSPKDAVGKGEPQLVVGYVGKTKNLQARIEEMMRESGMTWTDLARQLGKSRQAIVASLGRREVPHSRIDEICRLIGADPMSIIDDELKATDNGVMW